MLNAHHRFFQPRQVGGRSGRSGRVVTGHVLLLLGLNLRPAPRESQGSFRGLWISESESGDRRGDGHESSRSSRIDRLGCDTAPVWGSNQLANYAMTPLAAARAVFRNPSPSRSTKNLPVFYWAGLYRACIAIKSVRSNGRYYRSGQVRFITRPTSVQESRTMPEGQLEAKKRSRASRAKVPNFNLSQMSNELESARATSMVVSLELSGPMVLVVL